MAQEKSIGELSKKLEALNVSADSDAIIDPTEFKSLEGFFYIIHPSNVPDNVYKIGKTKQSNPNKRLNKYPKGSQIKFVIAVNDADGFEDYAIRKFTITFRRRMEFGIEYFEGSLVAMIDLIFLLWSAHGHSDQIIINKQFLQSVKPIGIQYFINEWYSHQNPKPLISDAYSKYVEIITKDFGSNEYAELDSFRAYMSTIINS